MDSLDLYASLCLLVPFHASRFACSILLGRALRNKPLKDMAFPHPKSRKDKCRNEDKPSSGGIVRDFCKRTINISGYRNAKDDVNGAKNPTFRALAHDPPRFTTFEPRHETLDSSHHSHRL